jgi:hypothetical protein
MRAMNALLVGGALLVALGLFGFIYAAVNPDGGDSVRGIFLFGTPHFPAMMGLVLIAAGYAVGLLNRTTWDTPQLV